MVSPVAVWLNCGVVVALCVIQVSAERTDPLCSILNPSNKRVYVSSALLAPNDRVILERDRGNFLSFRQITKRLHCDAVRNLALFERLWVVQDPVSSSPHQAFVWIEKSIINHGLVTNCLLLRLLVELLAIVYNILLLGHSLSVLRWVVEPLVNWSSILDLRLLNLLNLCWLVSKWLKSYMSDNYSLTDCYVF